MSDELNSFDVTPLIDSPRISSATSARSVITNNTLGAPTALNTGVLYAKVLRAWEESSVDINPGHRIWANHKDGVSGRLVMVKARIEGLHSYPDPDTVKPDKRISAINMHPIFEAKELNLPLPQPGTIIEVDFKIRSPHWTGPIYVRPAKNDYGMASEKGEKKTSAKEVIEPEPISPWEPQQQEGRIRVAERVRKDPDLFGGTTAVVDLGDGLRIHPGKLFKKKNKTPNRGRRRRDSAGKSRGNKPTNIILHESAAGWASFDKGQIPDGGVAITKRVLERKGLGVHYSIDRFGKIRQFADPSLAMDHAKPMNESSIGIEVYNPFQTNLPVKFVPGGVIPGKLLLPGSAKAANCLLPTLVQMESTWKIVEMLTGRFSTIPLEFLSVHLASDTFRWYGNIPNFGDEFKTFGIMSHKNFDHADGKTIEFYCVCRHRGLSPDEAYTFFLDAIKPYVNSPRPLRYADTKLPAKKKV